MAEKSLEDRAKEFLDSNLGWNPHPMEYPPLIADFARQYAAELRKENERLRRAFNKALSVAECDYSESAINGIIQQRSHCPHCRKCKIQKDS